MRKIAAVVFFVLSVQFVFGNFAITNAQDLSVAYAAESTLDDSTIIDESVIPDDTLRACLKDCIGKNRDAVITYKDIKDITDLDYPAQKTKNLGLKPIESIEGIECLSRLYSLDITGHNVKDLTPLENTSVSALWADDNKISVIPDFSSKSMSAFYIDRNHLSKKMIEENTPGNFATSISHYIKHQVTETVGTYSSNKYYEIKDKSGNSYYPFVMASTNLRTSREYSLKKVTVDGVDKTGKFELGSSSRNASADDYNYDCSYVYVGANDMNFMQTGVEHNVKAIITDEYDETFTLETDCIMEPYQSEYEIKCETQYLSTTGVIKTGIKLDYYDFFTKSEGVTVDKVELTDQDGDVYGSLTSGNNSSSYNLYDCRYDDHEMRTNCQDVLWEYMDYTDSCQTFYSTYSEIRVREELPEGYYDLVFTLSDGTKYIYKKAYEAVTRPIVYNIMDTDSVPDTYNAMLTDQGGNYVSVYVYGWNITKDAVKPVFYNEDDEEISGDVAAVETDKWGAYFRIKKENPTSVDWNIPLSLNGEQREGTKAFDVKVETEAETFENKVYITRREIFYQYFDDRDNTFTVYFGKNADVNTESKPTLSFVKYDYETYEYVPIVTISGEGFSTTTNDLTGHEEVKAKFNITDEQLETIKENEYNLYYSVEYESAGGKLKTHRSDYIAKHATDGYNFEDVTQKGIFSGYYTNVFYLPYWIGGVYSIDSTDEENYLLNEDDVAKLSPGKFAYASLWEEDISLDETEFTQRSNTYYFMKVGEMPTAPVGKPNMSVSSSGEKYKFEWDAISGANQYNVCFKYGDMKIPFGRTDETSFEIEKEILPMLFQEYFEECRLDANKSKMEIYIQPINIADGATAYGEMSNVMTVAEIEGSGGSVVKPSATPTPTTSATASVPPTNQPTVEPTLKPIVKKSIKFTKKSVKIKKGKKVTLKVTIKGAKKAVFSVDKKGNKVIKLMNKKATSVVVKGKKKGKATITAKAAGKSAKCNVTVK